MKKQKDKITIVVDHFKDLCFRYHVYVVSRLEDFIIKCEEAYLELEKNEKVKEEKKKLENNKK